jgi:hypothetical protein
MSLILHRGAREVPRTDLALIPTPPPERRWHPVGHEEVADTVRELMLGAGFGIKRETYALSQDNARMFATLDLNVAIAQQVTLTVGLRNSIDQTFPLGFCAGHRVFVCDNLCFSAELMVARKHTQFGRDRYREDIATSIAKLNEFRFAEFQRIHRMQEMALTEPEAESLVLRAMNDRKIISHRIVPRLLDAWRNPLEPEFQPRTAWSLFNAFTLAMKDRAKTNPQMFAAQTMRLQALFNPEVN